MFTATISGLNKKAYVHIEDWRNRLLQSGKYPYVYVDGIYLRRNWGGELERGHIDSDSGKRDGYREVLDADEGMKKDGIEETLTEYPLYVCNSGSILCLANVQQKTEICTPNYISH